MTFTKGKSGNSNGRPKGSDRRTQLRTLLEVHAEEIIAKVVEMARDGDIQAIKLCLERLIPKIQGTATPLNIESTDNAQQLLLAGTEVCSAVFNGEISPVEGYHLTHVLEAQRKLIETLELEKRLRELERANNGVR